MPTQCPNPRCAHTNPDNAVFCCKCGRKLSVKKGRRTRANGMGTAYRRGRTWTASVVLGWRDANGNPAPIRKYKGGFQTKREALEYCPILRNEKQKSRLTIAMQYDAWTDTKRYDALSDSKKTAYKIAFKRLEPIHHMDIGDVRLEDLQPIVDSVATYYPARDVRQVLSHLFKPAVIDGRAAKNYAEYIDLPQTEKPQKDAFNLEEVNSLWGIYELDIFAGYILLMIYTGMALGELQNVKREYVDLDKHMIHNVGTKNELRKRTPIFVCSLIEPVLLALYEKSSDSERLLNHNEDVFYKKYYEVLESAKCRKLTPHCCRHTTATALAQADVHPAIIKTIMRHSKYQTTTEYTHIDADAMVKALDKILR